jgi:hypothetical protein
MKRRDCRARRLRKEETRREIVAIEDERPDLDIMDLDWPASRADSDVADAPALYGSLEFSCMPSGFCPVQACGTIAGRPWYFRARHSCWEFRVGPRGYVNGSNMGHMKEYVSGRDAVWGYAAEYGESNDAGLMSREVAVQFIEGAARDFLQSDQCLPGEEGCARTVATEVR